MKPKDDWTNRTRAGHQITRPGFEVLKALIKSKQNGTPFVERDTNWHLKTLYALQKKDWIIASYSEVLDDVRYKITSRGEKIYKLFSTPSGKRYDGLCPRCGKHPRLKSSSYCRDCKNHINKTTQKYAEPGICPRCKKRPRHKTHVGVHAYCNKCKLQKISAYRKGKS